MSKNITVVIDAFSTNEYGNAPEYAAFTVNQEFLDRLEVLSELCKDHNLCEVRQYFSPEWGPVSVADDMLLQSDELVMSTGDFFYFSAYPKHSNDRVESGFIDLPVFSKRFNTAKNGEVIYMEQELQEPYEQDHGKPIRDERING